MKLVSKIKEHFFSTTSKRTKSYSINVVFMVLIKGAGLVLSLLYIPLLINTLNTSNYGIWLTLTSILSWLSFFDIGIGNGLRNRLAEALSTNDINSARSYVSTAYFYFFLICVFCIFLLNVIMPTFQWSYILNAPKEMEYTLSQLARVVFSVFIFQLLLNLLNSILLAIQKPAISSFVTFLSQLVSFAIIFIMSKLDYNFSLLHYGFVISFIPVCIYLITSIYFFVSKLRFLRPTMRYVDFSLFRKIFSLGGQFFLIQITSIVLFQTNIFIIAHTSSPESVVEYNVAYKYFGIILMIFSIITIPMWSATTDAYKRGDTQWIETTLKRIILISNISILLCIVMLFIAPFAIKIWLGGKLTISYSILLLTMLYHLISIKTSVYCAVINGIGKIRLQFYMTVLEAVVHIPLALYLGGIFGVEGVLLSMCLMSLINLFWEPIQVRKMITNTALGVWNK